MNALSVQQLTKIYPNGNVALNGIDFAVKEGDFFALLGQNGAGKSTTIGIISSLINKTSGKIHVFGHDIDLERAKAKSLIGVVPQELNFSLFENVTQTLVNQAGYYGIPRKLALDRAEYYLNEVGLHDARNHIGIQLSGGMKRRLMIARALMNEPKLLILDEPTAGVDIGIRRALWEFLVKLNQQGTTIILTTHYLEEAERLCKYVAIIDHGEIIEYSKMKSLIQRLDAQTLILDLAEPITSKSLGNYDFRMLDETSMEVDIRGNQTINGLFALLNQKNISVASMRNKINRLETLFINLISENKKK